ncbi:MULTISPECIES: MmyB family transcriptional regulator [unclassified Nonomuraea]
MSGRPAGCRAGELTLGFEAFTSAGAPGQTLGLYTVEPGSPSAAALGEI